MKDERLARDVQRQMKNDSRVLILSIGNTLKGRPISHLTVQRIGNVCVNRNYVLVNNKGSAQPYSRQMLHCINLNITNTSR